MKEVKLMFIVRYRGHPDVYFIWEEQPETDNPIQYHLNLN